MIKRDYYEVLGLDRGTSEGDIKKAYRQMAMKFHPDRNPDDHAAEEKFKEASEAYEVLSDSHRRQLYDAYGHQGLEGAGFHGFSNVEDIFSSMGSIFEEFFGGGFGFGGRPRGRRARAGADLEQHMHVTFMESFKGCEKEIAVTRQVQCETCKGSGEKPGAGRKACAMCGGSGTVTQRQGFFVLQTTCPQCRGEGARLEHPCEDCRGHGRVRKSRKINVKVPEGLEDGMTLVLRGEGEMGERGAPPGDLHIRVAVGRHEFFERHGDDVCFNVPISFPQAALGCKLEVPTLEGKEELEIHAGIESGGQLRIKGGGFPSVHNRRHRGDIVVNVVVKTPKKLSKKQRQLLEEFMKEE